MACVLTPFKHLAALKKGVADYPDVVIPYGYIDVDSPSARAELEAFAAAGVKGIKMHTPKYDWDDFGYFPLYQRMQELGLVALFHTGIVCTIVDGNCGSSDEPQSSSMARMRPSFLHTIARAFPRLRVQGAHLGNPWYDEAAEAARWQRHLYFDLTGSSLIKKQKNLAVFKDYLWWEGPTAHSPSDAVFAFEKLVFGTDEPPQAIDNMLTRYEAMLDACGVPEASRRKIYGETLARILGIPVRQ
jgi:predicted TIM-barrel fold metal-dependent hydrolase